MICRRYVISGRVQGVGFRAATAATARRLQLNGWVRNQVDGRVEVLAAGKHAELEQFEHWLWQGPALASVTELTTEEVDEDAGRGFHIR